MDQLEKLGDSELKAKLKKMQKQELIHYIIAKRKQKAFSHEDRLKLAMLDKAGITMWACDKDYKIILWTCKCEAEYGYTQEEAIGREYPTLFVAPHQQEQSKIDCDEIILYGKEQISCVAEDIRKNKTTIKIASNCFRIEDPDVKIFLQAEIGLNAANIEEEIKKDISRKEEYRKELDSQKDKLSALCIDAEEKYSEILERMKKDVHNVDLDVYTIVIKEISKLKQEILKKITSYKKTISAIKEKDPADKIETEFEEFKCDSDIKIKTMIQKCNSQKISDSLSLTNSILNLYHEHKDRIRDKAIEGIEKFSSKLKQLNDEHFLASGISDIICAIKNRETEAMTVFKGIREKIDKASTKEDIENIENEILAESRKFEANIDEMRL